MTSIVGEHPYTLGNDITLGHPHVHQSLKSFFGVCRAFAHKQYDLKAEFCFGCTEMASERLHEITVNTPFCSFTDRHLSVSFRLNSRLIVNRIRKAKQDGTKIEVRLVFHQNNSTEGFSMVKSGFSITSMSGDIIR